MNVALSIVKRFLKETFRSRSTVIYMIVMPIVFTFLFGVVPNYSSSDVTPIGIVDLDHTVISQAYQSALVKDKDYQVKNLAQGGVTTAIRNNKVAMVVTLPQGLEESLLDEKSPTIEVVQAPSIANQMKGNSNYLEDLKSELSHLTIAGQVGLRDEAAHSSETSVQAFVSGMNHAKEIKPVLTSDGRLYGEGGEQQVLPQAERAIVGFGCMFIFFTVFGLAGNLFTERKQGTWSRYKAAPVNRGGVIVGYSLSFFLLGWFQYIIMYLSGRFVFGITLPMDGWLVLTISLYILAVCGLALCTVGLVKSREQHMAVGSTVTVATCMIGGAYWPIDIEPTWMQHVAWFVPQNWALQAVKTIALGSPSVGDLLWPILALLGFTVVFLSAGMVQLRYS